MSSNSEFMEMGVTSRWPQQASHVVDRGPIDLALVPRHASPHPAEICSLYILNLHVYCSLLVSIDPWRPVNY